MEGREFLKAIERAHESAKLPELVSLEGIDYDQVYRERLLPWLTLEFYGRVALRATEGDEWATITAATRGGSELEKAALHGTMTAFDNEIQLKGFQTDTAATTIYDRSYQQLTVFWANGKEIYENKHGLTTFNENLVSKAIVL